MRHQQYKTSNPNYSLLLQLMEFRHNKPESSRGWGDDWEDEPTPPVLLLASSDDEGEDEVDKDHGSLVIGKGLPLPGQTPLFSGIESSILQVAAEQCLRLKQRQSHTTSCVSRPSVTQVCVWVWVWVCVILRSLCHEVVFSPHTGRKKETCCQ